MVYDAWVETHKQHLIGLFQNPSNNMDCTCYVLGSVFNLIYNKTHYFITVADVNTTYSASQK